MNPVQKDLTIEDSLKQVLQTLPSFIREYLSQGKYTLVAQGLMAKYKLRVDQGGVLERELMLLLMGIESPDEFVKALVEEAGLEQGIVNSIVTDVNTQVFVPLRKEEESLSKQTSAQPVAKPVSAPKPAMPAPAHIAPLPPKMAMPKSGSLGDIVRRIATPASFDAAKLLEDHEEPHIELKKETAPLPRAASLSVPKPVTAPQPMTPPAPTPKPVVPEPPVKVVSAAPPVPKAPLPPPVTSYEVDPYREPLDDK
jgi:hypothetical protein